MATRLVHHRSTVMDAGIPANASYYQGARAYCPSLFGYSSLVRLLSATYGLPMRLRLSPHRSALSKDARQTRCAPFVRASLGRAPLYRCAVNKDGLQPRCATAVCPSLITATLFEGRGLFAPSPAP